MARGIADQRGERCAEVAHAPLLLIDDECEEIGQLIGVVRLAIGRLGGKVGPWLDEGLLMSQGLITALELAADRPAHDSATIDRVVSSMRTWARGSSWYRAAWPCRIAPLCASLAERPSEDRCDTRIACDLGIDERRLAERYAEAGLLFGVSPELLLPRRGTAGEATLGRAISALPLQQRKLLTLYFADTLSFPEIAEALRISPAEAQTAFGRAAASIRADVLGSSQAGASVLRGGR